MMTETEFSDETLMAFADGELDDFAASQVSAAAEKDPRIAQRINMFTQTGLALGAAAAARSTPALSDDLTARINATLAAARANDGDSVVPFAARPARMPIRPMALAACVALLAGVTGGVLATLALQGPTASGPTTALVNSPDVNDVLATLPTGASEQVQDSTITIIASFASDDGRFCREYETDTAGTGTVISVACRSGDAWATQFAMVTPGADDAGYAPASSLETLDAYLASIGAGAPMSQEEEAAQLASE